MMQRSFARLRRWLRHAWLYQLPFADWLAQLRRGDNSSGERPQLPRLRPQVEPCEDCTFFG
jgi:hypothetical protein